MITWYVYKGSNMILNVDGSSLGSLSVLDFGGFIRNIDDCWVHGFTGNIGYSNILLDELMTLYHGLRMAWKFDIKDLMCYSDSNFASKLISEFVNA
ncbi:unnamed protein product [Lathyrus oleraceus]